jgi:hypothetical protein
MGITREEKLLNSIANGVYSGVQPVTREEQYLSYIAGESYEKPENPITRKELYLDKIPQGGGGGGENKLAQVLAKTVTELSLNDMEGVTNIGKCAFENCKKLQSVVFPSGLLGIGETAFYGCSLIKKITIPASVKTISKGAFYYCSALETVEFEDGIQLQSLGNEVFNNTGIISITFPNVSSIPMFTFSNCSKLESVEIPSSVTDIGMFVFQNCVSLESVTIKAVTPPTLASDSFRGCSNLKKITVPAGCGATYKSATNWSAFADIIVEEEM